MQFMSRIDLVEAQVINNGYSFTNNRVIFCFSPDKSSLS